MWFMELQIVVHDWVTELNWTDNSGISEYKYLHVYDGKMYNYETYNFTKKEKNEFIIKGIKQMTDTSLI